MKIIKIVAIVAAFLFVGGLFFGGSDTDSTETTTETTTGTEKRATVEVSEIELIDFKVNEPNSIGTIYMQTQFKNNSEYPIVGINYEFLLDGTVKTYLSTFDTIMPGETSAVIESFGPKSGLVEDAQLTEIELTVLVGEDERNYITYDTKLDSYSEY